MDSPALPEEEGAGESGCPKLLCQTRLRFQTEVTRVAVNATGSLAALCGKKLSIIGLTAPFAVARELALANKAAPLSAVFSPHAHQGSLVACHAGQSVSVFNLNDARSPLQATLQHQRNVRSFAWSLFDPAVVASCAADNAIHLWDLRDLKNARPASSLKVFTSGLASVRWNRHNGNLLASAHDIQVEIWDLRKSAPVTFITAHPTKIASIDWSPAAENELITSSADGTVKLWDVKRSRICQGTLQTGSPVAKALYAPSGQAVVVLNAPPALHARLWSLQAPLQAGAGPLLELAGNRDLCPDFALCERVAAGSRDVIAWSRDAHLCVWELPDPTAAAAAAAAAVLMPVASHHGSPQSAPSLSALPPALLGQPASPGPRGRDPLTPSKLAPQLHSLRDELDDMEHTPVEGLATEVQAAALARQVVVRTADAQGRAVALKVAFPSLYPHSAAPSFEFLLPETQLPTDVMVSLLAALQALCRRMTAQSQYCLRPALQLLRRSVLSEELMQRRRSPALSSSTGALPATQPTPGSSGKPEAGMPSETPCPRLSGASFSPSGRLVHFSNGIAFSVRTYAQLREALSGATQPVLPSPSSDGAEPSNLVQPVVTQYRLPHIAHVSSALAASYRLQGAPIPTLCAENAAAARSHGLPSVARAWQSLAAAAAACEAGALPGGHALARPLVQHILAHFDAAADVQTVAVMSRVLLSHARPRPAAAAVAAEAQRHMKARRAKPAAIVATGDATLGGGAGPPDSKVWTKRLFQKSSKKRADSDPPAPAPEPPASSYLVSSPPASSVVLGAVAAAATAVVPAATPAAHAGLQPILDADRCLIDPTLIPRYLALQVIYADLCMCLNLLVHRAQMLKLPLHTAAAPAAAPPQPRAAKNGLSFEPTCLRCNRNAVGARHCASCNVFLFACGLCRLPVGGLFSVCVYCGHGGHSRSCMAEWFAANDTCPTQGCTCRCKLQT